MTFRITFLRSILAIVLQGYAASAYAQILNPGFDTWSGGNPVSWRTNNYAPAFVPVTQTTFKEFIADITYFTPDVPDKCPNSK